MPDVKRCCIIGIIGCDRMNKYTIIVIVAFVLLIFIAAKAMQIFFPDTGNAVYGDRLDGIEEVKIKDSKYEQIIGEMKQEGLVVDISQETKGKLINFIITVADEASVADARVLADKLLNYFEDNQKKFYDFQVLIKKNNEEISDFPIIAYKHHAKDSYSWTKNREATQ